MCFAVKWDGRHKARLVAGGNWTEPDGTDVYSGVVTTEAVRIGLLVAAANDLEVRVGDVGNAYLHSQTREKIYTYAGPEFGPLQGRCLIILKALYGLRTSGARWHETFANDLMRLGFTPTRADPNMWIRLHGSGYEYIAVYVDDVLVFSKWADAVMEKLQEIYKMKGVGRPELYLGWRQHGLFPGLRSHVHERRKISHGVIEATGGESGSSIEELQLPDGGGVPSRTRSIPGVGGA